MFRIAPESVQRQFDKARNIFRVSRRLLKAGELRPDSDPKAYFHSIRQWAIWTDEQGFDEKGFERAFLEHARKNVEKSGHKWNSEIDKALRGAIPHRWRQVQKVLAESRGERAAASR